MPSLRSVCIHARCTAKRIANTHAVRKAEVLQAPLYKKRAEFVAGIPHFWCLVLEQAPPEIDNFIQPTDSEVFAECLDTFEVSRFELNDPKGSPRSFSLKFGFKENEWFENKTIEKKFWFRKTKDWEGLVSEPVKINWKKDKDLTAGLTDAAYKLFEARQKLKDPKKESTLPEHKALETMIETTHEASVSFFGLFAFVSGYRWVSAEESAEAEKEEKERLDKVRRGEQIPEEDEDDEIEDIEDFQAVEVFPGGDEVATILAEDLWQNAIKYYSTCEYHFSISIANHPQSRTSRRTAWTLTTRTCRSSMSTWRRMRMSRTRKSTSAPWSARARRIPRSRLTRGSARLKRYHG
jgi:hypothetical protein